MSWVALRKHTINVGFYCYCGILENCRWISSRDEKNKFWRTTFRVLIFLPPVNKAVSVPWAFTLWTLRNAKVKILAHPRTTGNWRFPRIHAENKQKTYFGAIKNLLAAMLFLLAKNVRELNSKEMFEKMVIISDAFFLRLVFRSNVIIIEAFFWYCFFFFFEI